MNLILFEPGELQRPLPPGDRRTVHLLEVLHRRVGDTFDAGVIDGPRGKATITAVHAEGIAFTFLPQIPATAPSGISLLLGLPRPQTARDLLRDATSLGVAALHFVLTEKTEAGYAQSRLWATGEWRRHLIAGAEQAFDTRLPVVTWGRFFAEVVADFADTEVRLALDNYEAPSPLGHCALAAGQRVVLAIGGERGWSTSERALLGAHGFRLHHLGSRILRTETACTAALSILRAKLGLM